MLKFKSRRIQILILIVLLLILGLVCINLALSYPNLEFMLVRPIAGFFISAIIGAVFRELKERKKIKKNVELIFPKIKKRKPKIEPPKN